MVSSWANLPSSALLLAQLAGVLALEGYGLTPSRAEDEGVADPTSSALLVLIAWSSSVSVEFRADLDSEVVLALRVDAR